MTSPYIKLQNSKKQALAFVSEVIDGKVNQPKTMIELNQELAKEKNLTEAIAILAEMKDKQNNIDWYKDGDNLVRDGRAAKNPPISPSESYAIQYLNHVRAAISLIEDVKLQNSLKDEAIDKIKTFLAIQDIPALEKNIAQANANLAIKLMRNGVLNASKKIRIAKDFANFQDHHYHITTIANAENTTVIESEMMHLGLTQAQKVMFKAISEHQPTSKNKSMSIKLEGHDMSWFNKMDRWQQNQIQKYAPAILTEKHVIPTQLRSIIPLMRNAYTKVTAIKQKNEVAEEILESMHSGALSDDTKGKNLELIIENIRQLRQFAGPGSALHMNALLSPANPFDADANDDSLVRQASNKMFGVIKTTTPFNFLRKWINGGGRDLSGSVQILQQISKILAKDLSATSKYLQSGNLNDLENASAEIAKLENSRKRQSLENAVEAMKDINSLKKYSYFNKDLENTHSCIAINMKLVSYAARKGILGEQLKDVAAINTYCKSGKDRTPMIEIGASIKALNQTLSLKKQAVVLKDIKSILSADHAANMSGVQGGSLGCYGIKVKTVKEASEAIFKEVINYMTPRTSNSNKFETSGYDVEFEQVAQIKKNITKFLSKNAKMVNNAVFSKKQPGIER